uniref:Uncharacterized protein n=1 Tax=Ochrobactrum phage ORM_20 TaxID=2985243 RepID=A0A9N6WVI0_9VIRU|nr:hypothetical protein ORM20_00224 [Ochrobactrum phage ORM_20]
MISCLIIVNGQGMKSNIRTELAKLPKEGDRIFYGYPFDINEKGIPIANPDSKIYHVDEVIPVIFENGSDYIIYVDQ